MAEETPTAGLLTGLSEYVDSFEGAIDTVISKERKELLKEVAAFVDEKNSSEEAANLIFICTHNSRRSHMSQLWAQTAAYHYGFEDVHCYSGGTEATAFNPRAVKGLKKAGFNIDQTDMSTNPRYKVSYSKDAEPVMAFSKKYDDGFDLLDKVVVETNMDRREMVLFTEEGHSYQGLGVPLELTELESNHFGIPVTIRPKGEQASREVILKMDTGADNHITFHKDAVDGYGLLDKKKRHKV